MKTFFISWEIRQTAGEIAYSNTITETEISTPLKVYETALHDLMEHYGVGEEKITARSFNEI